MSDEIHLAQQGAAITRALRSALQAAREAGCQNPSLYFEPEAATIYVMDRDHPHYLAAEKASAAERQEAVVAHIQIGRLGAPFDAGAW